MDKWLPEDEDAMERYYEILNQEGWKEMQEFFELHGNEDVLQSYGLTQRDMKKLAQAAMESTVHSGDKLNERVSDKVHIEVIRKALEGWENWDDSRLDPIEIFIEDIPLEYDVTEDQINTILDDAMGMRYENLIDFAANAIYKDIKTAAKGLTKYYKPVKENKLNEGTKVVEAGTGVVIARALIKQGFSSKDDEEKLIDAMVDYLKDRGESNTYIFHFTNKDGDDIGDVLAALDYFDTREGKKYLKDNPKGPYESELNEKLARGLSPLLKKGSIATKKMGEEALLKLSDDFENLDNEQADKIASSLNMAIENIQDGYAKDATGWLKKFNKACKDALSGKEVGSAFENELTEARRIQTKRKYTENHPERTVGTSARIRNKILETIKDGRMTQSEFDKLVKELSSDNKRWMKRNGKMFNVSEEGISLSKFGQKILKGITVNESFSLFIKNK
jgi:hypothetical protein